MRVPRPPGPNLRGKQAKTKSLKILVPPLSPPVLLNIFPQQYRPKVVEVVLGPSRAQFRPFCGEGRWDRRWTKKSNPLTGGAYRPPRTPLDPGPPARGAGRRQNTAPGGILDPAALPGRRPGVQEGPGGPEAPPVWLNIFLQP